jgi:hypothetical protein
MPPTTHFNALPSFILWKYTFEPGSLFLSFGFWEATPVNIIAQKLKPLGGGISYGLDSLAGLLDVWRNGGQ